MGRLGLPGACFAQVVKVPDEILRTPAAQAAGAVHGIDTSEIAESHTFPTVWAQFLELVERCLNDYVQGDARATPMRSRLPLACLSSLLQYCGSHNGYEVKGLGGGERIVVAASSAHSSPGSSPLQVQI